MSKAARSKSLCCPDFGPAPARITRQRRPLQEGDFSACHGVEARMLVSALGLRPEPKTPAPRCSWSPKSPSRVQPTSTLVSRRHDLAEYQVHWTPTRKGALDHGGRSHSCQPIPRWVDCHTDDDAYQNDCSDGSVMNSEFAVPTGANLCAAHSVLLFAVRRNCRGSTSPAQLDERGPLTQLR